MRPGKIVIVLFVGALLVGTAGCGVDEQPKRYQESMGTPKNTPTPYPTRSVPSTGFDRTRIPERFRLMQSGPYWVQLVDPEVPFSSIVVGIEPTRSGRDLEAAVESQRTEMDNPPQSQYRESGAVDSPTLGTLRWTWSSYRMDDEEIEQLALFGSHPADGCLVIARSEYPAKSGDRQAKLDELVAITSIIGPGL